MGRVVIAAGLFLLGAGVGGLLTWLVITWRAIGGERVRREPPRMIVLPPVLKIDMDRPSKAIDIARRWKS